MATTASALAPVQVPAHIAARIAARQAGSMAPSAIATAIAGGGYSFPQISIRAGRFRLVEDSVETPVGINLDVVIVGVNPRVSKVFYAKAYDGTGGVRPDCFSNDGITPDPSIAAPVSKGCAGCPHNALGSKITPAGAQSKMCGDQRHLAVVPAADPTKAYGLTISVSAMKNLREYIKELQNNGIAPEESVTELGFDDKVSYPKVTFRRKGFVPASALSQLDALVASDEVKEVTRVMPPRNAPALAAPAQHNALTAPAPVAPPVEDGYEETGPTTPQAAPLTQAAPVEKPTSAPVKVTSELEARLDSLFNE